MGEIGRPRRFKTARQLEEAWEAYKEYCDNQNVLTHEFSAKNSEFVSKELRRSITYTVEGFCVFIKLPRSDFYATYVNNEKNAPKFKDIATRIKEECEIDARRKFELQMIPAQLAGLWMSRYGYTVKNDSNITGSVPVVISGDEALED